MDTILDFKANSTDVAHLRQDHTVVSQLLKDNFEKTLVTDAVSNAVLGVKVAFFDASHTLKGSVFLQNLLTLSAITETDFLVF